MLHVLDVMTVLERFGVDLGQQMSPQGETLWQAILNCPCQCSSCRSRRVSDVKVDDDELPF